MNPLKQSSTLIIIPVYNEEKNIGVVIDNLQNHIGDSDILVINDGSIDNTLCILEKENILTVSHPFNLGIGASFQTGCQFALEYEYSYIIRIDGDGQHDAHFIKDILEPVKNNEADIVIGSRFLGDSEFKSSFFRGVGIFIISWFLSVVTKSKITDPTSGFCAMNKKAYKFFAEHCVEDYPEPEILIYHRNFRIKEVSVAMLKRRGGASSITPLKSIFYMYKVIFSLLVSMLRKE